MFGLFGRYPRLRSTLERIWAAARVQWNDWALLAAEVVVVTVWVMVFTRPYLNTSLPGDAEPSGKVCGGETTTQE